MLQETLNYESNELACVLDSDFCIPLEVSFDYSLDEVPEMNQYAIDKITVRKITNAKTGEVVVLRTTEFMTEVEEQICRWIDRRQ